MAGVSFTSTVSAQDWLTDLERAEGRGFQLGRLELHPGIGIEGGYDSNVFYSSNPQGSGLLRITPHLNVTTLGEERRESGEEEGGEERAGSPPSVDFSGGLSASYFEYFRFSERRDVSIDTNLALTIAPERPFFVEITESFSRSIRPFTDPGPVEYGRDRNVAGVRFNLQSRGGIFSGSLGYRFGIDIYEDSAFQYANNLSNQGSLEFAWRFLPQTALLYDLDVYHSNYTSPGGSPIGLSDGVALASRFGINGAFTRKFSMLAMVGYVAGFYDVGDDYDSVTGELEARFQFSPNIRFKLGYQRAFSHSPLGNFYSNDRGYLKLEMLFGGRLLLALDAGVGYLSYGAISGPAISSADRNDVVMSAAIFGEYRFLDWLAANATLRYTGRSTDFQFDGAALVDPAEDYNKVEFWLGVRAFY